MSNPNKSRLITHFENRSPRTYHEGWANLWDTQQEDLWDRGKPSPALIDLIQQKAQYLPKPQDGGRLKALVPACGRGYDVVMLALHGFDVYGLEINEIAVAACKEYARQQLPDPDSNNFGEHGRDKHSNSEVGHVKYIIGDFFTRDWEVECDFDLRRFDLIYDYTFLCAIKPEMRQNWARRMKELLAPNGILVCLEFPLYKDLEAAGPPYGLKGVYDNLLTEGKNGIFKNDESQDRGDVHSHGQENFELVLRYKPESTHDFGEGTDMLSIWRHWEEHEVE